MYKNKFQLAAASLLVLGSLSTHKATAQTTRPVAKRDTAATVLSEKPPLVDTQGGYVAPGMTGAPKQRVLTNYQNEVVREPKRTASSPNVMSSEGQDRTTAPATKSKRLKWRRATNE